MKNCKKSHFYSNSINTKTIQARSQLFINFISPKLQDCIGVTYTATQSTLELFKLEVDYSSTLFQQKVQDCIGVTYTATQSTLQLFKLEVNYSSTLFWQKLKIAKELHTQQLNTGII